MSSPTAPPSPRRQLVGRALWLGLGLTVGAVISHLGYWYLPRMRPVSAAESLLLTEIEAVDLAVWVPYPHQNLTGLASFVDEPAKFAAALVRLAGGEATDRQLSEALGGWGFPPASELVATVVQGPSGETEGALGLRPYPSVRWVARAAGGLAGNPWLSGGELSQRLRTEWRGTGWWLRSGPPANQMAPENLAEKSVTAQAEPSLARIAVGRTSPGWPAGVWDLRVRGASVRLQALSDSRQQLEESSGLVAWSELRETEDLVLAALDPAGWLLLVFDGALGRGDLPSAVVVAPERALALEILPASRLLGRPEDVPSERGSWGEMVSTDRGGVRRALAAEEAWAATLSRARQEGAGALWIDLRRARAWSGALADLLEDVPLIPPREGRRWRDLETVFRGLARFDSVRGWWSPTEGEIRLE